MTRLVRILCFVSFPIAATSGFTPVSRHPVQSRSLPSSSPKRTHRSIVVAVQDDQRSSVSRRLKGSSSSSSESKQPQRSRWPRLFSKIMRRGDSQQVSSHHESSQTLHMTPNSIMDPETEALLEDLSMEYSRAGGIDPQDFILRNFQELSPTMVLPEVDSFRLPSNIEDEFFDVAITSDPIETLEPEVSDAATKTPLSSSSVGPASKTATSAGRNLSFSRFMGSILENALTGIITRRSIEPPKDLLIQALPRGGGWNTLINGKFRTDARIDAGRLVFPNIRMSSGTLNVKRLSLNLLGFFPGSIGERLSSSSRFLKQFDLHFDKLTFSQQDILGSSCIHNGLRLLLVRILRDRGVQASTVQVTSVDILSSGKISLKGEAKTLIGSSHDFEVRSGIGTSSRGHVLTFPGLEISLNRDLGFFVPVVPAIDLDVGHNARFRHIEIDGQQKSIRLDASVTITPTRTIRLSNKYAQSAQSFSAKFFFDVGQWFTEQFNFTQ